MDHGKGDGRAGAHGLEEWSWSDREVDHATGEILCLVEEPVCEVKS
jgi:hypothetical protein